MNINSFPKFRDYSECKSYFEFKSIELLADNALDLHNSEEILALVASHTDDLTPSLAEKIIAVTPSSLMSSQNAVTLIQYLEKSGEFTNEEALKNCIFVSAQTGNLPLLQKAIESYDQVHGVGSALKLTNDNRKTPLHVASQYGRTEVALKLIELGASVDARDEERQTPLHAACLSQNLIISDAILRKNKELISKRDGNEQTALDYAEYNDVFAAQIRAVLADIKKNGPEAQIPQIFLAASIGHLPALQKAIAAYDKLTSTGSALQLKNEKQQTLLHIACMEGHTDMALWLIEQGADITATNADGQNALHLASINQNIVLFTALFEKNQTLLKSHDLNNQTPITYATMNFEFDRAIHAMMNHYFHPAIPPQYSNPLNRQKLLNPWECITITTQSGQSAIYNRSEIEPWMVKHIFFFTADGSRKTLSPDFEGVGLRVGPYMTTLPQSEEIVELTGTKSGISHPSEQFLEELRMLHEAERVGLPEFKQALATLKAKREAALAPQAKAQEAVVIVPPAENTPLIISEKHLDPMTKKLMNPDECVYDPTTLNKLLCNRSSITGKTYPAADGVSLVWISPHTGQSIPVEGNPRFKSAPAAFIEELRSLT